MIQSKILLICPFAKPNIGGVETHIEKLINYLISKKYFPVLLTYQPLTRQAKGLKHEIHPKYEIYRQNWFGFGLFNKLENYFPLQFLYLFPGIFYLSLKYYLLHHQEIKCIHAHGLASAAVVYLLKKIHRKRTVISTHAIYKFSRRPLLSFLIKSILSDFDKILAVSQISLEELNNIGIPLNKIVVHPNWIDTSKFKYSLKTNPSLSFLFVGRLIEKKGIGIYLDTATKFPQIIFNIVGEGPELKKVFSYCRKYKNIKHYGALLFYIKKDTNKLLNLYQQSSYLVSPYLYDEGFSSVLIESLACGTPLIITNRGSPPTFIPSDLYHSLPPNPTSSDLIDLITKISTNQIKKISSIKCSIYAQKNFGPDNAEVILKSYG